VRWNHFQDILPVLTLAIGYAGTFVTERFRNHNEERRARVAAVQNFERSVLLDTQAALYLYAGEMQDFAFALRGQSDRSYSKIVGTAWRASAQLEMLTTRISGESTRDALGEVLATGQAIASGSWPNEDDWSDDDRALLDKAVDTLLDCEQRAALLLGDRLRTLTYSARTYSGG
jgi:hypothetical protein